MPRNVLKLDYDTPVFPAAAVAQRLRVVAGLLGLRLVRVQRSRTRRGWHVVAMVDGPRLTPVTVVAMQAVCGSDWRRESFNLLRALQLPRVSPFWRERWNVLYSRKLT